MAAALRAHRALLADAGRGAQQPSPGAAVAAGVAGRVAAALVHVAQHAQVGLAQLCRQRREQRHFRAIARLQARALRRLVQAVFIGARIHMAAGQRKTICLQARAVFGGNHFNAAARGRHAQITHVDDAHGGVSAGHGRRAAEQQAVTGMGPGRDGQFTVLAHIWPGNRQHRARRCRCRAQLHRAAVAQAGQGLVKACEVQGRSSRYAVHRGGAEGIDGTGLQRALGHFGRAAVAVGRAAQRQAARALLGQKARPADRAGPGLVMVAGIDFRVVAARHVEIVGNDHVVGNQVDGTAVIHEQAALAQAQRMAQLDTALLEMHAVAHLTRMVQHQGAATALDELGRAPHLAVELHAGVDVDGQIGGAFARPRWRKRRWRRNGGKLRQ